ncbi:MAG: hypothetical protein AB7R89_15550 [Dehalococcoidia bacterium]
MQGSEPDIRATVSIRPIRLVRDAEVLRIPRPHEPLEIEAEDDPPDVTNAPALI